MAKLARKTLLQFGSTVNAGSEIGQYGSYASPIYSADIDVIQAGTAWPRGWAAETVATNRPFLEDMNAVDYVYGYMLAYLLQMGIAEYDAGTTYYLNSIVQIAGQFYISLQDANVGNAPASSSTYWLPGLPGTEVTGVIKPYAGTVAPTGYLLCDGSAINRTTYAKLFTVCGTTYGAGNGTTTFNIPDMRGNTPVGLNAGDDTFGTLGLNPGEKKHQLSVAELAAHGHTIDSNSNSNTGGGSRPFLSIGTDHVTVTTANAGSDTPHNNVQPSMVVNYIIKT